MTQRFIVRLLTADDRLVAWAEVHATATPQTPRGASCPFFARPTNFVIEQDGTVEKLSVHWPDLDVARVQQILQPTEVKAGQVFTFTWMEPVWLVAGMRDVPLPQVTVRRSVTVAPLVGGLAAAG